VPRVKPRSEQMVRAERLRDMGLVSVLHPDRASSSAITSWLNSPGTAVQHSRKVLDMGGVPRVAQFLANPLPRTVASRSLSLI
jgi:predicted glycosyltransferase